MRELITTIKAAATEPGGPIEEVIFRYQSWRAGLTPPGAWAWLRARYRAEKHANARTP